MRQGSTGWAEHRAEEPSFFDSPLAPLVITDPISGAVLAVLLDEMPSRSPNEVESGSLFSWLAVGTAAALLALIGLVGFAPPEAASRHGTSVAAQDASLR